MQLYELNGVRRFRLSNYKVFVRQLGSSSFLGCERTSSGVLRTLILQEHCTGCSGGMIQQQQYQVPGIIYNHTAKMPIVAYFDSFVTGVTGDDDARAREWGGEGGGANTGRWYDRAHSSSASSTRLVVCLLRGTSYSLRVRHTSKYEHRTAILVLTCFVFSSVSLPPFLPSVWSCRVVLLNGNHLDIGPANGNLVLSGLGLRPVRMHNDFGFVFFFPLFLSPFPLRFFPFCPFCAVTRGALNHASAGPVWLEEKNK